MHQIKKTARELYYIYDIFWSDVAMQQY